MQNKTAKVTIFSVCILLGFFLALQLKSVRINESRASQPARIEELSRLLIEEQSRSEMLYAQVEQYKTDVERFRAQAEESGGYAAVLAEQLKRAELLAGKSAVHGPGVIVTLRDSAAANTGFDENAYIVHDSDLLRVINELRAAGAEAISLNGERVLATSEIRCAGPTVSINNTRYAAPFVIKAIGDADTMERSLMMRSGIVDELKTFQIEVTVEKHKDITVEACRSDMSFRYALPVEEAKQ